MATERSRKTEVERRRDEVLKTSKEAGAAVARYRERVAKAAAASARRVEAARKMLAQSEEQDLGTINIPCTLNRASLGKAEYVFAILHGLADGGGKVAWVPRRDVQVDAQPLTCGELTGQLTVPIRLELEDGLCLVALLNKGQEELVLVRKQT